MAPKTQARGARPSFGRSTLAGALLAILAAAAVFVPPVVYQYRHFHLGWHDVGLVTRVCYLFFDTGRLSDAQNLRDSVLGRLIIDGEVRHLVPFFALLSVPVRLFDTPGYETLITAAIVSAAGYAFALGKAICRSWWVGALCAIAYVANPYTFAIALSSHFESFGVLFLLGFAYHSYVGDTRRAWLMLVLGLLLKEDMWLYLALAAAFVAQAGRLRQSLGFAAAAAAYYLCVVHPAARVLSGSNRPGLAHSEWEVAMNVLGRWRDVPSLLFSGPGLPFQVSFLLIGALAWWRYACVCGVLLIWLTLPGGPARTDLGIYYSFPVLSLMFILLPFALNTARRLGERALRPVQWKHAGAATAAAAMALVVGADVWMHVPGHVPKTLEAVVDPRQVYSAWPYVKAEPVRFLINRYLPSDAGSVMAQYFTIAAVPQRPKMYLTGYDKDSFLDGGLRPDYVLLDLGAVDPGTPPWQDRAIAAALRQRDAYEAVSDADGVLLYRRIGRKGP